jgi:Tol biopolymer transport system component
MRPVATLGGYILFTREGSLLAQPFDAGKLELAGDAIPIAEGFPSNNSSPFSVSSTAILAYRAGAGTGAVRKLTWFDREGKQLGTAGDPGEYNAVSLSPDGTRAAVDRIDGGNDDIWLHEFGRGITTRLTSDPAQDFVPVWSPDGARIIFSSTRGGGLNLYRKAANGVGADELVNKSNELKFAQDWSRDGRFLLYSTVAGSSFDLWMLPLEGTPKPEQYLRTEFRESQGRFSPDGRFVAYTSNSSGRNEIYVQPFPMAARSKWQVSKGGGVQPRWRGDGKEIFYVSADSQLMAVEVATSPVFKVDSAPKALFRVPIWGGGLPQNVTRYDVTADGKKFLVNAVPSEGEVTPITVIMNWQGLLKK